jgi:putative transposase
MRYDPDKHHSRSIRLRGYDYSQSGVYFVTVCTSGRECFLGEVLNGEIVLSDAGVQIKEVWEQQPDRYPNIQLDAFVIMPNHTHGVVILEPDVLDPVGASLVGAHHCEIGDVVDHRATTRVTPTLGDIVGAFKSITTVEYIRGVKTRGWRPFSGALWQRNYYEQIIRSDAALEAIRAYILSNPSQWPNDPEHSDNKNNAP